MSDAASARECTTVSSSASVRRQSRLDQSMMSTSSRSHGPRRGTVAHRPSIAQSTGHSGARQSGHKLLENTYRMEPQVNDRFQPGVVEAMLGKAKFHYAIWFEPASNQIA